jgi:hypothetical protein
MNEDNKYELSKEDSEKRFLSVCSLLAGEKKLFRMDLEVAMKTKRLITPNKEYWNLFRKHQRQIGLWPVPHPSRFSPLTGL